MFEIRLDLLVAHVLTFLVCAFLIWKFAWKHILGMLDGRTAAISKRLQDIEDTRAGIEEIKAQYRRQLEALDQLRRQKISEALEEAKLVSEQIKLQAHSQAEDLVAKAREEIAYELSKAKQELKNSVIDLAMSAAKKLIQEDLRPENDKKLIEDFLKMVEKA
jgi:F-type H+-transporting ATPase subunit b